MPSDSQSAKQNPPPIPPRFTWLRRGALGFILLLLILLALRLWWGHEANRRIADLARAAYARGEPFYPEDFRQQPVDYAENAAIPIQAAVAQLVKAQISLPQSGDWKPLTTNELPAVENLVAQCQPELQLARSARERSKIAFPDVTFGHRLPHESYFVQLARVLELAAEAQRAKGNDGQSLEFVRDIFFLAKVLDHAPGPLTVHVAAFRIHRVADNFLLEAAMDFHVSRMRGPEANREQVFTLIRILLDDRDMQNGLARGYFGQRADLLRDLANFDPSIGWFLGPAYTRDAARLAEQLQSQAIAAQQSSWPAAFATIRMMPNCKYPSQIDTLAHPLRFFYAYPTDRLVDHFRLLADRHVLAIMLALRLYEIDHRGARPESLSQLAGEYLPTIPRDPFDASDGPVRYLPRHDPPLLYSVGEDGKDNGGVGLMLTRTKPESYLIEVKDILYPLVPQPRIGPPRKPATRRSTVSRK